MEYHAPPTARHLDCRSPADVSAATRNYCRSTLTGARLPEVYLRPGLVLDVPLNEGLITLSRAQA